MYFSVRPPLPFGAGSLSSSFFSEVFTSFYETTGLISAGVSTFAGCCFFIASSRYFFYFSSFSFFFCSASSFFLNSYFSFAFVSFVNFSKLTLQLLTMIYSAFFWLEKKSVFLLKNPKTLLKKVSIFPVCCIIVMRIPSYFASSDICVWLNKLDLNKSKYRWYLNNS